MNLKLKSPILIAVIVLVVLVIVYYFFFTNLIIDNKKPEPSPQTQAPAGEAPVLPETPDVGSKIGELSNPLGDKLSDLNPVEKVNPFKDVKTNPFR